MKLVAELRSELPYLARVAGHDEHKTSARNLLNNHALRFQSPLTIRFVKEVSNFYTILRNR